MVYWNYLLMAGGAEPVTYTHYIGDADDQFFVDFQHSTWGIYIKQQYKVSTNAFTSKLTMSNTNDRFRKGGGGNDDDGDYHAIFGYGNGVSFESGRACWKLTFSTNTHARYDYNPTNKIQNNGGTIQDDIGYSFSGYSTDTSGFINDALKLTLASTSYSYITDTPYGGNTNAECGENGDLYVFRANSTTYLYDSDADSYTTKAAVVGNIFNHAINSADELYSLDDTAFNNYNYSGDSWSSLTATSTACASSCAGAADEDKIISIGGRSNYKINQLYTTGTDSWVYKTQVGANTYEGLAGGGYW